MKTLESLTPSQQLSISEQYLQERGHDMDIDHDEITHNARAWLEERGYEVEEILFDLSCSQGSGASFTGKIGDIPKWLANHDIPKKYLWVFAELSRYDDTFEILRDNSFHYVHEKTVEVEITDDVDGFLEALPDDEEGVCRSVFEDCCNLVSEEIYKDSKQLRDILQNSLEAYERDYAFSVLLNHEMDNGIVINDTEVIVEGELVLPLDL